MSTDETSSDPVPSLDLGDFDFGFVPNVPHSRVAAPPAPPPPPDLGVLALLVGKTFKGPGYNCIFRPRSKKPLQNQPVPGIATQDNDLQLSLTVETMVFSDNVGAVPNRGLASQPDVLLAGVSYVDSVKDVTNDKSGRGDLDPGVDIHIEPGLWMNIPPTSESGVPQGTLCRMASIPHGTTINAQGLQPSLTPVKNAPTFQRVSIQPFFVNPNIQPPVPKFNNQTLGTKENRIPLDLGPYNATGTINQAILDNPNQVLTDAVQANAAKGQTIIDFIRFDVTTVPTTSLTGGGTANIAFLGGPGATIASQGSSANAWAASMKATFWLETVQCKLSVQGNNPNSSTVQPAGPLGPTFTVPPTTGRAGTISIPVTYKQLQYSQTVMLNFAPPNFSMISWPHVSVATMSEQGPIAVSLP